ncbi:hypothetical protein PCANC_17205 [Puccinia coronata f. sp. avenae]|uniref:Uncharacterized protein n=1 Tax=Puccinia coronata f. sp. avenae TaxID=200324 RepID=A0A2N5U262_9BASI|nr:hypothetical protein PCANC_17205 [Puccinia coronata f. sp. avenae]
MAQETFSAFHLHSLNKILASFELQREWKELSRVTSLEPIGYPFNQQPISVLKKQPSRISTVLNFLASPSPAPPVRSIGLLESQIGITNHHTHAQRHDHISQLPLFRLLIQRVWGAFPGLIDLPIKTWLGIERFILDFNRRNFSTSRERRQFTKRAVISIGFTKLLSSYMTSIIRFRESQSSPTRPSPADLQRVSQLPSLISRSGSRIKFVERDKDEFLVIYRIKVGAARPAVDASAGKHSSPNVKISVIKWPVLCELLQIINPRNNHQHTLTDLLLIQQLFNLEDSSRTEKIYQVLDTCRCDPAGLDAGMKAELGRFLAEEQDFQKDWIDVGKRVSDAKQGYKTFLHKVVHEDGEIDRMYELVAAHDKLETVLALDPMYEQAQTWAIMWIAYMLHFVFITGPGGDEVCELFLKIDKLVPYELIKQGLRIINPTLAIRTTITLIFGQPFGSLSLFQRILDSVVKYEIRALDTQMQTVVQAQPIDNPSSGPTRHKFLEAILKFVYLPEEEKRTVRKEFDKSEEDIIILILQWSNDFGPVEMDHVHASEQVFKKSRGAPLGPNLFTDLILLLRLASLKRDREQIISMITEPDNPIIRTIKQVLEMYYPTIYKVALASDLSKKFGETEAFLKDLVALLASRQQHPVSVDKLVHLLHRHKQAYWSFLNDLVKCDHLCDPMKEWIQSCFNLVKSGLSAESEGVSSPGRFGLSAETLTSGAAGELVREETGALSAYNRLAKMVDDMQYRLVFAAPSPVTTETSFLAQAFQTLAHTDPDHFARHLALSSAHNRPPLPFGWAWWIDQIKWCGTGADWVNSETGDDARTTATQVKLDAENVPSQLVVNSDLQQELSQSTKNVLNICKHLRDLGMTPKQFMLEYLTSKNSELATLRRFWATPKGWESTITVVKAIRGKFWATDMGRKKWIDWIQNEVGISAYLSRMGIA